MSDEAKVMTVEIRGAIGSGKTVLAGILKAALDREEYAFRFAPSHRSALAANREIDRIEQVAKGIESGETVDLEPRTVIVRTVDTGDASPLEVDEGLVEPDRLEIENRGRTFFIDASDLDPEKAGGFFAEVKRLHEDAKRRPDPVLVEMKRIPLLRRVLESTTFGTAPDPVGALRAHPNDGTRKLAAFVERRVGFGTVSFGPELWNLLDRDGRRDLVGYLSEIAD